MYFQFVQLFVQIKLLLLTKGYLWLSYSSCVGYLFPNGPTLRWIDINPISNHKSRPYKRVCIIWTKGQTCSQGIPLSFVTLLSGCWYLCCNAWRLNATPLSHLFLPLVSLSFLSNPTCHCVAPNRQSHDKLITYICVYVYPLFKNMCMPQVDFAWLQASNTSWNSIMLVNHSFNDTHIDFYSGILLFWIIWWFLIVSLFLPELQYQMIKKLWSFAVGTMNHLHYTEPCLRMYTACVTLGVVKGWMSNK